MAIFTSWGYDVVSDDAALPPILSADELAALTSGRFSASTEGVESVLAAVSAAIRGVCGWHVAPILTVEEPTQGPERTLSLHTMCVSGVESVTENGVELDSGCYEWSRTGQLRRCQWKSWPSNWRSVVVRYNSGLPDEAAWAVKTVAAQVASNALAAPAGVSSEQAGDVSIKYNSTASGVSGGVRLLPSDVALLEPYTLKDVWS